MKNLFRSVITVTLLVTTLIFAGCDGNDNGDDIFYVAVGASDALGVGAIPPNEGYVFGIQGGLEEELDEDVDLAIVALPGAGIELIEEELELFLETDPDPALVTVWVGSNDVVDGVDLGDFEEDLEGILSQLRDETSACIVIGNVPDLTRLLRFIDDPDEDVTPERIMAFNDAIERQAEAFDVPVVNLFAEMITEDLVFDLDGFHPSNEGHERIADLFLEVISDECDF